MYVNTLCVIKRGVLNICILYYNGFASCTEQTAQLIVQADIEAVKVCECLL